MSSPTTQAEALLRNKFLDESELPLSEDELPFEDGEMHNSAESPQTLLLTEAARPVLEAIHPDGRFFIGADVGVYYQLSREPDQCKCVAPDWCYAPGAWQMRPEGVRKSYRMWENPAPTVVIEYASNGGAEERDPTPDSGKFWIYENRIKADYYAIFVPTIAHVEVYHLVGGVYEPMRPNEAGRYPIPRVRMELGVWHGTVERTETDWLRWWSPEGQMLPTDQERAEAERQRADAEQQRADAEQQRADAEQQRADAERRRAEAAMTDNERLRAMLRSLGHDPDAG